MSSVARGQSSPTPKLLSRDSLLCAGIFLACLLAAWPFAQIGVNDDWSYILTTQAFVHTHHFVYNGWGAPMLGWQVLWGALFASIAGPTYVGIRLSILPIAAAAVLLYHAILRGFGLNRAHASFGTLALVLGPLFFPLSATFMTDLPGLFGILLCVYLCQRALAAQQDRSAQLWLIAAAVTNVFFGTVRQIVWLGLLVIVPCCGYLLRHRRRIPLTTVVLWIAGGACIWATMHWFNQQPYVAIESVSVRHQPHGVALTHFINSLWRSPLDTLLFCLPVLAMSLPALWPPRLRRLAPGIVILLVLIAVWFILPRQSANAFLLPPWSGNIVASNGFMQSAGLFGSSHSAAPKLLFALLAFFAVCLVAFIEQFWKSRPGSSSASSQPISWRQISILLLPFLLVYCALLIPRAIKAVIFDRYLLEIIPVLLIYLLAWHQQRVGSRIPSVAIVVLVMIAALSVAGTHDLFSMDRARVRLLSEVESSGVPRSLIQGGFEYDATTQVKAWGYINDPHIRNPPGAYKPPSSAIAVQSCIAGIGNYAPALHPVYVLAIDPAPCLGPSPFPPVTYRTWLPPGSRHLFIGTNVAAAVPGP
jgi:hypothetical protein